MKTKAEILKENPDLLSYQVMLLEDGEAKGPIAFDCYAADDQHATEQALDAYPEAKVVSLAANAGNESNSAANCMSLAQNSSNALPLIPPEQAPMSLEQCQNELSRLRDAHHQAVNEFWGSLKKHGGAPNPQWSRVQLDLYDLKQYGSNHYGKRLDTPSDDITDEIGDFIRGQLDEDKRKSIDGITGRTAELKAIISDGAESIVVHRLDGEDVYGAEEDALNIDIDESAPEESARTSWWYGVRHYEYGPESHLAAYDRASLYIVGAIDQTGEWRPMQASPQQMLEIQLVTDGMESLLDSERLPISSMLRTSLPNFPSGHEEKIRELELLEDWLYEQGHASPTESQAINVAAASAEEKLKALESEIDVLKEKYEIQLKEKHKVRISAFLAYHGLNLGQEVVNPFTSERGTLVISGRGAMTDLEVLQDGQELGGWKSRHSATTAIRRKEWVSAESARHQEALTHGDDADEDQQHETLRG